MKTVVMLCVLVSVAVQPVIGRADDKDVVWGALLGASAGLILSESLDGVHSSGAVPIGALVGGVIGYERNRRIRYVRGYGHYSAWSDYPVYDVGYRYPYRISNHRGNPIRHAKVRRSRSKKVAKPRVRAPNYHPGVNIVKVQIHLSNGAPMDVRLLRMPDDTFVVLKERHINPFLSLRI